MSICYTCGINEESLGGIGLGGSALITDTVTKVSGGIRVGGSAPVSTGIHYDAAIIYPLMPPMGQYQDVGPNQLHGVPGKKEPSPAPGVFCLPSSMFIEDEDGTGDYIELPLDGFTGAFTVSLWANVETIYKPRTFYSKGSDPWSFSFGYGFLNHLVASFNNGIEPIEVYGDQLEQNRWYHLACVFDGSIATVYIDGIPSGSGSIETTIEPGGSSYIGRWQIASYPTARMQEVRIYPEVKEAAFLRAERDNFCVDGFFALGSIVDL